MDEISLLTAVRPAVPEFPAADRAAARQGLLAAIAAERAAPAGPAVQRPFRRTWTPRRIAVAGAVAALVAVAALLIALPSPHRPGSTPPGAGSVPASARGLLLLAAHAAATTPSLTPGPRQFVYTEQLIVGEAYDNGSRLVKTPPYLQRAWISANGMWGGLARARNVAGGGKWYTNELPVPVCAVPDPANPNWKANCPAPPGYVTTLPSTVPGMLAYLEKLAGGLNGTPAYGVLASISQESWESRLLIPNQSYALMFRAASAVPGIRVIRHVTDAAGRSGVAVAACLPGAVRKGTMSGPHGCGHLIELIFDPRTYQFIGDNETGSLEPGSPSSALLKIAVVGKAGQLP
jgi:hypothetical protein